MKPYIDSLDFNPLHTTTTEKPKKEIITNKLLIVMGIVAIANCYLSHGSKILVRR